MDIKMTLCITEHGIIASSMFKKKYFGLICQHKWRDLFHHDLIIERIFTLKVNKTFILPPKITRKVTTDTI